MLNVLNELIEFNFSKYEDMHGRGAALLKLSLLKGRAKKAQFDFVNKLHWIDSDSTDDNVRAWAQDELNGTN